MTKKYEVRTQDGGHAVYEDGEYRGWYSTRERAVAASRRMAWGETVQDDTEEPYPRGVDGDEVVRA